MSFIIGVHVNEGIVLASDRRATYNDSIQQDNATIQRFGVHFTDSTDKTFICKNGAGISICGDISFQSKPITGYIQEMIRSKISEDTKVSEMPQIINDYFSQFEEEHNTIFMIAGYEADDNNASQQKIFIQNIGTGQIDCIDTSSQGATWQGETVTMTRLFCADGIRQENGSFDYCPQEGTSFQFFTLQDAVDFAKFAVETTVKTMHFKNMVETVGGSVDILVITPEKTEWLQKEVLKVKD